MASSIPLSLRVENSVKRQQTNIFTVPFIVAINNKPYTCMQSGKKLEALIKLVLLIKFYLI